MRAHACCNFEVHRAPGKHGHVYFIRCGPYVKIGFTNAPIGRLTTLQTASPVRLDPLICLPGDQDTEKQFHARFVHRRVRGEWFWFAGEIQAFVECDANLGLFWDMKEAC